MRLPNMSIFFLEVRRDVRDISTNFEMISIEMVGCIGMDEISKRNVHDGKRSGPKTQTHLTYPR